MDYFEPYLTFQSPGIGGPDHICKNCKHSTNQNGYSYYCIKFHDAVDEDRSICIGDDDQKIKADYGKAKLVLVPRRIIWDIAAIREYGNEKYPDGGPNNWKQVEVERYRNAAYRHFMKYLDDPKGKDNESGFPHLWHLACNIAFLCELEDNDEHD